MTWWGVRWAPRVMVLTLCLVAVAFQAPAQETTEGSSGAPKHAPPAGKSAQRGRANAKKGAEKTSRKAKQPIKAKTKTLQCPQCPQCPGQAAPAAPLEPVPEVVEPVAAETPSPVQFELHGFADGRIIAAQQDKGALLARYLPALATPRAFSELDVQPRLHLPAQQVGAAADVDLYFSTTDPKGLVLINEAYVDLHAAGSVYLLVGRRRIIWGSGIAANPTDLLNPPVNPLDLEQQRTGAFLLPLLEVTTPWLTISALASPKVTTNSWALPTDLSVPHMIVGGRVYALVEGTDVTLMYFHDDQVSRSYGGLNLSRFLGDHLELHFEGLVGQGPAQPPPFPEIPQCGPAPTTPFQNVMASLITGGRYDLSDQSFVSAEYYFNGNGFDAKGFSALVAEEPCIAAALQTFQPGPLNSATAPNPVGHPIDPLFLMLRQHYAVLTFQRPHLTPELFEALSIGSAAVISLEELSVIAQVRLAYSFGEAVSVGVTGATETGTGGTQFRIAPTRLIGFFDLHASF